MDIQELLLELKKDVDRLTEDNQVESLLPAYTKVVDFFEKLAHSGQYDKYLIKAQQESLNNGIPFSEHPDVVFMLELKNKAQKMMPFLTSQQRQQIESFTEQIYSAIRKGEDKSKTIEKDEDEFWKLSREKQNSEIRRTTPTTLFGASKLLKTTIARSPGNLYQDFHAANIAGGEKNREVIIDAAKRMQELREESLVGKSAEALALNLTPKDDGIVSKATHNLRELIGKLARNVEFDINVDENDKYHFIERGENKNYPLSDLLLNANLSLLVFTEEEHASYTKLFDEWMKTGTGHLLPSGLKRRYKDDPSLTSEQEVVGSQEPIELARHQIDHLSDAEKIAVRIRTRADGLLNPMLHSPYASKMESLLRDDWRAGINLPAGEKGELPLLLREIILAIGFSSEALSHKAVNSTYKSVSRSEGTFEKTKNIRDKSIRTGGFVEQNLPLSTTNRGKPPITPLDTNVQVVIYGDLPGRYIADVSDVPDEYEHLFGTNSHLYWRACFDSSTDNTARQVYIAESKYPEIAFDDTPRSAKTRTPVKFDKERDGKRPVVIPAMNLHASSVASEKNPEKSVHSTPKPTPGNRP